MHWRGRRMTGYRYVVRNMPAVDSSDIEQTFYVGSTGNYAVNRHAYRHGDCMHLLNPGNYERSLFRKRKRTFGMP